MDQKEVLNNAMFRRGGDRYHTVYQLRGDMYKIVQLYQDMPRLGPGPKENQQHHDKKLDSSYSRAKRDVLEYALCNPWDWFVTLTLDKEKQDRFDLEGWHERFLQWVLDQRKKGLICKFLLIPEQHEDGAWHAHGFFSGNMEVVSFKDMAAAGLPVPDYLRSSDYFNWPLYQDKFGFCSLGPIRDPVACGFYVTKYITKDMSRCVSQVGKHLQWHSRGLIKAHKYGAFVNRDPYIDSLLCNKYDFCATGMIQPAAGWDQYVAGDIIEALGGGCFSSGTLLFESFDFESNAAPSPAEVAADDYFVFTQLAIDEIYNM